ncbi:CRISPR-associated protein, Csd1 family [Desulfocapsa sulfexigens DSM 10523]|uniref:CRISPR-associated protein, Csd1 family n=1 Tax=Desulfocapsa sulfexigens (strain DSM 10523 / SB164P1) TaxID=1167006 RepID=M1PKK9_DESSD|nr:type I-C CRISPR-associated protein Cas8c/Csd1 [Desulfocapsa sulfexigens]AGF80045.1 CRISPR-associated protein, Csd1 family [Desulfocapsa sulfexigens DSM 10523]
MILQALCEYYERRAAEPNSKIAPIGFAWKEIPFVIVLDRHGKVVDLQDTRQMNGKKLVGRKFLLPKVQGRSGQNAWATACLLWDHFGYVLGHLKGESKKDAAKTIKQVRKQFDLLSEKERLEPGIAKALQFCEKYEIDAEKTIQSFGSFRKILLGLPENLQETKVISTVISSYKKDKEMADKQLGTFKKTINTLPPELLADEGVAAVVSFYATAEYQKVTGFDAWPSCREINGCNLTFRLDGDAGGIAEREAVITYQKSVALVPDETETREAYCLVTGKKQPIQRLHAATAIAGGKSTAGLVSFQKNSGYDSYGKEQGFNAPVGKYAQAAYSTALSTLLTSNNRIFVGDATTVFWAGKATQIENDFSLFFTDPPKDSDDPDAGIKAVRALYESIYTGSLAAESDIPFYVLGLSPNAARISVRFWSQGTVLKFAEKIKNHFDDLEIVRSGKDQEFFSLHKLLSHTAFDFKISNVPPNLAGAVMQAIFEGKPYPVTLFQQCMRRIRAERHVNRIRAAILKAYVNRRNRYYHKIENEEISVSLDKNNMNPAYRLGRLFAVLENIQKRAQGKETIRERFYGAASSSPVSVFPQLLKLKNHHLAKLKGGAGVYFETILGEIFSGIVEIPAHLPLDAQARFAVGYYHQRQDLFTKKEDKE